jgi:hypothetical protein
MHETQKIAALVMRALQSSISLRLCLVTLIPAPHPHKRSCRQMYVLETLDSHLFSKRKRSSAFPMCH